MLGSCYYRRDVILQKRGFAPEDGQQNRARCVDILDMRRFLHSSKGNANDSIGVALVLVQCELFDSVQNKHGVYDGIILLWL